jgi:hypothetical protein
MANLCMGRAHVPVHHAILHVPPAPACMQRPASTALLALFVPLSHKLVHLACWDDIIAFPTHTLHRFFLSILPDHRRQYSTFQFLHITHAPCFSRILHHAKNTTKVSYDCLPNWLLILTPLKMIQIRSFARFLQHYPSICY